MPMKSRTGLRRPGVRRLTQGERTESTRKLLLKEARELFARDGFAATSIDDIVATADLTKGALYHHFPKKEVLFEAVFLEMQQEIGDAIRKSADETKDPWQNLLAGCRAFLTACMDPMVQRIVLQDAPGVLGWTAWRAADERFATAQLREALVDLHDKGRFRGLSPVALTALINGALNEGALHIAGSEHPKREFKAVWAAFVALLDGLPSR